MSSWMFEIRATTIAICSKDKNVGIIRLRKQLSWFELFTKFSGAL